MGSVPGQGTKILHATWYGLKKKKKASCGAPMRGHKSSRFGNGSGFQGPGSFTPSGGSGKWEKVCLRLERTVGERAVSPKAQPSAER